MPEIEINVTLPRTPPHGPDCPCHTCIGPHYTRPPTINDLLARIAVSMEKQLVNYAAALEVQREGVTLTRDHLNERRKENEAVTNREDKDRRLDKSLGAFIRAWDEYSFNGLDDTFELVEEARRELAEAMKARGVVL